MPFLSSYYEDKIRIKNNRNSDKIDVDDSFETIVSLWVYANKGVENHRFISHILDQSTRI